VVKDESEMATIMRSAHFGRPVRPVHLSVAVGVLSEVTSMECLEA
jgi:hypothetical protein